MDELSELSWDDLNGLWDQLLVWDEKYPVQLGHRMYLIIEEMERRMSLADRDEKQRMMASIAERDVYPECDDERFDVRKYV